MSRQKKLFLKRCERAFIKLRNERRPNQCRLMCPRTSMYSEYMEYDDTTLPFLSCSDCGVYIEKNYFREFGSGTIRQDVILCKKCSEDAEDHFYGLVERSLWDSDF
jgi:hypothetical protein